MTISTNNISTSVENSSNDELKAIVSGENQTTGYLSVEESINSNQKQSTCDKVGECFTQAKQKLSDLGVYAKDAGIKIAIVGAVLTPPILTAKGIIDGINCNASSHQHVSNRTNTTGFTYNQNECETSTITKMAIVTTFCEIILAGCYTFVSIAKRPGE